MSDPLPPPLPPSPPAEGQSYALVAQACAMAVQDAVAYLRNVETVANAVIGVAQERLLAGADGDTLKTIATAQETVSAAVRTLEEVSAAATKILLEFPRN
ncbi:MAG: hypothetical protein WDN08_10325 [Rhizomicrobium sp.]